MPESTTPLTAPYAVLESHRSDRPELAVVFGPSGRPNDELMVIIDPTTGEARGEFHCRDFEGHGTGTVTVRRPNHRTCTAVGWLTIRGIDVRNEACESFEVSLAVTWSLEPGRIEPYLDVAGTSLVYGAETDSPTRLAAIPGHSFNRFALTATDAPSVSSNLAAVLAA